MPDNKMYYYQDATNLQPKNSAENITETQNMQQPSEQSNPISQPNLQNENTAPETSPETSTTQNFGSIPQSEINNDRQDLVYDVKDSEFDDEDGNGLIMVQASTARGSSPVPEATVIISKNRNGQNSIVSFNLTDASGKTPNVSVPAPKKTNSQSPSDSLPFADYDITVRHPMYYIAKIDNVQVFGDELTIQSVDLIPLPEFVNERDTTITTIIPKQNL